MKCTELFSKGINWQTSADLFTINKEIFKNKRNNYKNLLIRRLFAIMCVVKSYFTFRLQRPKIHIPVQELEEISVLYIQLPIHEVLV